MTCDYGHDDDDVRRLPIGKSGAGIFVCLNHWLKEIEPHRATMAPGSKTDIPREKRWSNLKSQDTDTDDGFRALQDKNFKSRAKKGYSVKDGFGLTPAKTKGVNTVEECGDCGFAGVGKHNCPLPNKSMAIFKARKKKPSMLDHVMRMEGGEASEDEGRHAMQQLVNSGDAWRLQGSYGREAMDRIEAGHIALGHTGHRDYYGNYVPSRHEVEPNTKGHPSFVRAAGFEPDKCGKDCPSPEVPDQLPKNIRNKKITKSQVIFKSEDPYERCGADGCDHARANHSGNICHECFKHNGSANPIITHAFQSKPGNTGRIGVPSRSQRLDTILSLRDKFHGTATDKTEKSKREPPRPIKSETAFISGRPINPKKPKIKKSQQVLKAKSATMYSLRSQKTGRGITHVANITNESSHVFGGGGRVYRGYSNASAGRMLRMRDRSSGVMGKIRQKFGAPKLYER